MESADPASRIPDPAHDWYVPQVHRNAAMIEWKTIGIVPPNQRRSGLRVMVTM